MKERTWVYVGGGEGVPGLAHELCDSEARRLGVYKLLREAIDAGKYVEKKEEEGNQGSGIRANAVRPNG